MIMLNLIPEPYENMMHKFAENQKRIFDVLQNRNAKGYASIKDILVDTFDNIEKLYNMIIRSIKF